MRLSRTGLKELSKRYKDILLKCLCLNAIVFGYGISFPVGLYAQIIIPGGTLDAPVNAGAYSTNSNVLEFANGIFELPDMQYNFTGDSTENTIRFSNATAKLMTDGYYSDQYVTYSYFFDDTSIIDLRYDDYPAKTSYWFDNLSGEGASIAFYVSESNGKLISDQLYSETSYVADFDPFLISIDYVTQNKEYNPVQVLDGKAEFNSSLEGKEIYAAATSGYESLSKVIRNQGNKSALLQSIQFMYNGPTNNETLSSLNQFEGNAIFFHDNATPYQISGDLGVTGFGEKTIKGVGIDSKIVVNSNTPVSMFQLKKDSEDLGRTTSLLVQDLTIENAESVLISEKDSGSVVFNNVQILGQNLGLIQNGSSLTVENSILKNLVNKGTAQLSNSIIQGKLDIEEGHVSLIATNLSDVVEVKGKTTILSKNSLNTQGLGTIILNGVSGTGIIENTGNLIINSETQDATSRTENAGVSLKNTGVLNLSVGKNIFDQVVNNGSLTNESEMHVISSLDASDIQGNGLIVMEKESVLNSLDANTSFESTNHFLSNNMIFADCLKKVKVANLTVAENSILDIKNIDVTVKELVLSQNSTLQVSLNGITDYGTITGEKLNAQTGSSIQFNLGANFTSGIYQVFNMQEISSLPLVLNLNEQYKLVDLKNGSYSFELNKEENTISFIPNSNQARAIFALQGGKGTNNSFNIMQEEVLNSLRSDNIETIQKGKDAARSIGSNYASTVQSVSVEQTGALINAIALNIQGNFKSIGRSAGEEASRASVWTKALYSKTKDSSRGNYKIHGAGGILGVQTRATDSLKIGIGYAYNRADIKQTGRDTTIDNNTVFGYFKYQPSLWFIDGVLSYSRGEYEEEKFVLSSQGRADYQVDVLAVQSLIGYDYKYKCALLTPKAGFRYMKIKQEAYMDSFGTKVNSVSSDYLTLMLGMDTQLSYKSIKGIKVRPTASVLFGYDLKTDDIKGVNTLSNGSSYIVDGKALPRFSTNVKLGWETKLNERTSLTLEYLGSFRNSYQDHGGMLKLEYNF